MTQLPMTNPRPFAGANQTDTITIAWTVVTGRVGDALYLPGSVEFESPANHPRQALLLHRHEKVFGDCGTNASPGAGKPVASRQGCRKVTFSTL